MYVHRNSYVHQLNEAKFRFRALPQYADNNVLIGTKYTANIQGFLTGTDAADLNTKWAAIQAAYASTAGDFKLYDNDATTELTSFTIQGSKMIGGIRCTRCEVPMDKPGDLTTFLNYEIDIEADAGGIGLIGGGQSGQSTIVSWTESITVRGTGGPRFVLRENRNGAPQKQIVSQRTPVTATQRGEAVGLFNYPTPSNPLWPQHLLEPDREATRVSADTVGGTGNQQQRREYRNAWNYQYWAPGPLTANPSSGF